ncbi:hypothetical protein OAS23_02710 [Alphaproteobacteria bacterium]|nr:hypothetical protein [Alphaproteobacteria bacterium]
MIKFIIILLTISFYGCTMNSNISKLSDIDVTNKKNPSINALYLSANYSISKGDAYTAAKTLNSNIKDLELLKLKFISNLISGNFKQAYNISNSLNIYNKKGPVYELPKFALALKNYELEHSLLVAKKIKKFLNLHDVAPLISYWLLHLKEKKDLNFDYISKDISIYKLLILENFYESKKLKKIVDKHINLKNLNNNDLLLLAGYYFRVNDIDKFKTIIQKNLPNQFDKKLLMKSISKTKNIFNEVPNLNIILASKIYNNVKVNNLQEYSYSHLKILLELALYLYPNMDIAKYSLAEIYYDQKSKEIALKKLNSISSESFFYLASNLKKLSILKSSRLNAEHKKHLFKIKNKWPNNKFIMLQMADYFKSKSNFYEAIQIYKKIIENHGENNRLLFLYASSLDKMGDWHKAKELLITILKKDPEETYTLNYFAYSLALRDEELNLALNHIKKALSLDPNNGFFLDTLGWVEFKRENYISSVFYLEKSIMILPRSSEVMDHLGDCYLMLGRTKEAVYEWKKALKYENNITVINSIKDKLNKYE